MAFFNNARFKQSLKGRKTKTPPIIKNREIKNKNSRDISDKKEDHMKDKSGPAFPYPDTGDKGMTLRDYFAGQVLIGWMANAETSGSTEDAARLCYKFADAMLKANEED